MSVDSRIIVGLTLELGSNLSAADFERLHALEEKYPEIDEFNYNRKDREGKLLLIYDGMCSQFARLVYVDKYIDGGNLGKRNEFFKLAVGYHYIDQEVFNKMSDLYEEYCDHRPAATDFQYALWSQWY